MNVLIFYFTIDSPPATFTFQYFLFLLNNFNWAPCSVIPQCHCPQCHCPISILECNLSCCWSCLLVWYGFQLSAGLVWFPVVCWSGMVSSCLLVWYSFQLSAGMVWFLVVCWYGMVSSDHQLTVSPVYPTSSQTGHRCWRHYILHVTQALFDIFCHLCCRHSTIVTLKWGDSKQYTLLLWIVAETVAIRYNWSKEEHRLRLGWYL